MGEASTSGGQSSPRLIQGLTVISKNKSLTKQLDAFNLEVTLRLLYGQVKKRDVVWPGQANHRRKLDKNVSNQKAMQVGMKEEILL